MKAILYLCLLLGPGLTYTSPAYSAITGEVGALSNFIWRGITFTENRPAIQADIDAEHSSGFYLGTFISNAEFRDEVYDAEVSSEVDFLVGKRWEIGNFNLQIYYSRFIFPGASFFDSDEFNLQLKNHNTLLELSYLPRYFGYRSDYRYVRLTQQFPVSPGLSFSASLGYNSFSHPNGDMKSRCLDAGCANKAETLSGAGNPDYLDAFLAFTKEVSGGAKIKFGLNLTNRQELTVEEGERVKAKANDLAVVVAYIVPFSLSE